MENPNTKEKIDKEIEAVEQRLIAKNIPIGDGVLHNMELLRKYDNRNKQQEFIVVSMEKENEKKAERFLKRTEASERKAQRDIDMAETMIANNITGFTPINFGSIDRETLDEYIEENPFMENQFIHIQSNRPYECYGQTHTINVVRKNNKYGKSVSVVTANTKQVDSIRTLKSRHFGSIQDYIIDSLPKSLFRAKGTEKIVMYESDKENLKGMYMISRRFISKLISFWSYMTEIRYLNTNPERTEITGTEMWGYPLKFDGYDNKKMEQYFGTGKDSIKIIKDILFVIRNKEYNSNKISPQLNRIITLKCEATNKKPQDILNDMKNRIYYEYQINESVWSYPKVQPEYLINLLEELKSGHYDLTLMTPLIYDLRNFPIKCTDMHIKPMTNKEHEFNKEAYDLTQYVFERNDGQEDIN